jgi:hypothetical protein
MNNYLFRIHYNNNIKVDNMTNLNIKKSKCNFCENKSTEILELKQIIQKNIDILNNLNENIFSKLKIITNLQIETYNSNLSNIICNNCT